MNSECTGLFMSFERQALLVQVRLVDHKKAALSRARAHLSCMRNRVNSLVAFTTACIWDNAVLPGLAELSLLGSYEKIMNFTPDGDDPDRYRWGMAPAPILSPGAFEAGP